MLFVKSLYFNVDKGINFEKVVERFSEDVKDFECKIDCIGETRKFLWIPAKNKYIVTVSYNDFRYVNSFISFVEGVLS